MFRIFIGSVVGGFVQFLIGALFWATPLSRFALRGLGEAETADLQTALARTLAPAGAGTYFIPSPETASGAVLMGKGPVGLIFFSPGGYPAMNWGALGTGLVLSIVMLLLVGVALSLVDGTAARLRVLILFAAATSLYFVLSEPVFNFYMPWAWWVYSAISEFIAFVAGGLVLVRWFMPVRGAATLH